MQEALIAMKSAALEQLALISDESDILAFKNSIFGKNGKLTEILKGIKDLQESEKLVIGKLSNEMKNELQEVFEMKLKEAKMLGIRRQIEAEYNDVTLPSHSYSTESVHPITKLCNEVFSLFAAFGFFVYQTGEISDAGHDRALQYEFRDRKDGGPVFHGRIFSFGSDLIEMRSLLIIIADGLFGDITAGKTFRPLYKPDSGVWLALDIATPGNLPMPFIEAGFLKGDSGMPDTIGFSFRMETYASMRHALSPKGLYDPEIRAIEIR